MSHWLVTVEYDFSLSYVWFIVIFLDRRLGFTEHIYIAQDNRFVDLL